MNYKCIQLSTILLLSIVSIKSETIIVDGIERNYIINFPANWDKSQNFPLLIALHGGGGEAKKMNKHTGLNGCADKFSFVLVYPDGIEKSWNDGREVSKKYVNGI